VAVGLRHTQVDRQVGAARKRHGVVEADAAAPEIPTYQEAGIKGLVLAQWLGVLVPAGTPAAIVERLNAEINKALADPAIRENLLKAAQEPVGGSAAQFAQLFGDDYEKYERLVKELGIKVT
jgi:tripartite-type tricarboxylate transporter receptor subunit TctC